MKRQRAALCSVGFVYALAWFVQVIKDGDTLADGTLPGWQALRLALSPLWDDFKGTFVQGTLCVLSGLTNLIFVAGCARLAPRLSWILFGAAALNTFWIIDMFDPSDMRAGYWLWLSSFVLLGFVARLNPAAPPRAA